jgi:RNA polymerase sigma-70 factor (ECF subfamily)
MPVLTPPSRKSAAPPGRSATATGTSRKTASRVAAWKEDPEVRLMLRVRAGDDDAFTELQERYAPRVFGYFCRQLRDRSDAEDLTQDVFLRLYRSRNRYEPRARFATWIFHITQNVARNALRSRRRHPCVHLDPESPANRGLLEVLSDRAGSPSRPLERDELAGVVRAAVAELAGRQRTALELHQFQDCTYAEVAAELDMTPKAAKSLLYRARNQLREVLLPFMS